MATTTRRTRLHVQLDVHYAEDPKIIDAGERAELLYVRSLAFTARRGEQEITQGQFTRYVAAGVTGAAEAAERLVAVGLWEATARGYLVPAPRRQGRPPIPRWIRNRVMARDGRRCVECRATDDLTLDHIWPWSLGGEDTVENLRVLCRPCNSRKGARI